MTISNICSYIPFCSYTVETVQEHPISTVVTTLFATCVALIIYDTIRIGAKIQISRGDDPGYTIDFAKGAKFITKNAVNQ